jgi:hypothetical protein
MHKKLVFILLLGFSVQNIFSQKIILSVFASAGDYKSLSGYSLSWTMGEVMTEMLTSDNIRLTQGFQQPGLAVESGIHDEHREWSVSTYPNPVFQDLIISFQGIRENRAVLISLTDMMGRIIILKELKNIPVSYNYRLEMNDLERGIYILKIYTQDYRMQKLFKIEKQ